MARAVCLAAALGLLAPVAPALAESRLEPLRGHLAFGYGRLFIEDAPSGSLTVAGGLDYPVRGAWRAGVEVGYWLLGTRLIQDDFQGAELDYSMFEALAQVHWTPPAGPLGIVSFGPGVVHARADLTTSAPGAFSDLAIEETALGLGLSATLITRRPALVRAGLEVAARTAFVADDPWTVLAARLVIHY